MAEKYYQYFFTRQDLSPEQQIVQTAHVALVTGKGLDDHINPREVYFVVVGVRNETALHSVKLILDRFGFEYEVFVEPDWNNGEATSIGLYPVKESQKGVLEAFNLLKL